MASKTLGQTITWLHTLTYQTNKLFRKKLSVLEARHKETVGKILLVPIQVFFFSYEIMDLLQRMLRNMNQQPDEELVTKVKVSNKGACVLLEHGAQHGDT